MQSNATPARALGRQQLADAAGVNAETLRFYEKAGLIAKPPRSSNGYRRYSPATVRRIAFIRQAKTLGFTLREIKDMVALRVRSGASCRASMSVAERKIAELDARIASLRQVRRTLAMFLRRCQQAADGEVCEVWSMVE